MQIENSRGKKHHLGVIWLPLLGHLITFIVYIINHLLFTIR